MNELNDTFFRRSSHDVDELPSLFPKFYCPVFFHAVSLPPREMGVKGSILMSSYLGGLFFRICGANLYTYFLLCRSPELTVTIRSPSLTCLLAWFGRDCGVAGLKLQCGYKGQFMFLPFVCSRLAIS